MLSGICGNANEICILWNFMQHRMVVLYRRFGITYWSHHQRSSSPRSLTLEDGTSRLSQNVSTKLPFRAAQNSERAQISNKTLVSFLLPGTIRCFNVSYRNAMEPVPRNSDTSFQLQSFVFCCTHTGVASPSNCVIIHTAVSLCVKHMYTKWGLFSIGNELTIFIHTSAGVSQLICLNFFLS